MKEMRIFTRLERRRMILRIWYISLESGWMRIRISLSLINLSLKTF